MLELIDLSLVPKYILQFLPYIPHTLLVLLFGMATSIVTGLVFVVIRFQNIVVLNQIVIVLISWSRGTPLLTQLFLVYYGLPELVKQAGWDISRWDGLYFAAITFGLAFGSNTAETLRGAIASVGKEQLDAALSVGMTRITALYRIILPQAMKVALPNLSNIYVSALKATSIVFSVGIVDLMSKAKMTGQNYFHFFESYVAVGIIYFFLYLVLNAFFRRLEKYALKGSYLAKGKSYGV
jgi:L-cystine transport system permease protein